MTDSHVVTALSAAEILDSRGFPTVEVSMAVGGVIATASVPSGKSTGRHEALERRDGDQRRHGGKGVLGAVGAVRDEIAPAALAAPDPTLLPVPCFNVINGGAHAPNELDFQEFMVVPAGLGSLIEALRCGAEIYHALAARLEAQGLSTAVGDEGGFAPAIRHPTEALDLLVAAIEHAGYRPGEDAFIALDPAASAFHDGSVYRFAGERHDAASMTAMYGEWLGAYPILSIEDGLAEDDQPGWVHLTRELGGRVQLVGDDIFVSDPERVRRAIAEEIANAVLLKPNQIGTVTEICETASVARAGGFRMMMSLRSGETSDAFIADLAVALGTGQIKAGAPARGERVAKYNRLAAIERTLGAASRFAGRAAFTLADRDLARSAG